MTYLRRRFLSSTPSHSDQLKTPIFCKIMGFVFRDHNFFLNLVKLIRNGRGVEHLYEIY